MPGGTLEKKVADGFEVLEVQKGSWVEAIFAKKKAPATKLRFFAENEYDEDGNRIRRRDEDDDEEEVIDDRDDEDDDEDNDDVQPNEDDDTFYSSYAPEADVKVDDDDDTEGLSVLE